MSGPRQDQIDAYIVSPIPFGEYAITSPYGYRTLYGKRRFHAALDIKSFTSIEDAVPIVAMADGEVVSSYFGRTSGQLVGIKHNSKETGLSITLYMHMVQDSPSKYGITKGVQVKKGQVIGIMGSTGSADRRRNKYGGRHLHLEARDANGKKFDLSTLFGGVSTYVRITKKKKNVYVSKQERGDEAAILSEAKQKVEKYGLELVPGGGVGNAELEEISDEELKASIMGFFLPKIIKERQKNIALARDDGIIRLRTKNRTAYAHNMVLSRADQSRYSDFSLLTTNEISNLVPFVEIYVIKKLKGNKENHILFPFDDYSQKTKIENIFFDKTGRGGNIGIKSVDWKTIGTNFSNVNQVTVSIKIHIQDIQDIETRRNGVSLLDLLYPAGTRNNEYDDKNFNIKLKLGWLYKMNPSLTSLRNKLDEKLLQENIFISLYKHDFEFNEAGSVTLSLEYIGMLESKISNPHKYDVLDLLAPEKKEKERDLKKILSIKELIDKTLKSKNDNERQAYISKIKSRSEELNNYGIKIEGNVLVKEKWVTKVDVQSIPVGDLEKPFFLNNTINPVKKVKERQELDLEKAKGITDWLIKLVTPKINVDRQIKQEERELAQSYLAGLQNLLNYLSDNNLIKAFTLEAKQKEELKTISLIENATLTKEQIENYFSSQNLNTNNSFVISRQTISKALTDQKIVKYEDKNITIDKDKLLKALLDINKIAVPYTFLGEIISYFNKLFFNNNDAKANKEFRVVLGDFSYRDIGMTQDDKNSGGDASARPKIQEEYVSLDGKIRYKYGLEKKYASLADIPISIESLLGWYNEHVADTGIEKLSYNSFLKSIFNNLVPANLTNQILDIGIGTKRTVLTSFSYIDIPENKKIEEKLIRLENQSGGSRYELDFSQNTSKNAFYKIKARSNITKSYNLSMQNYIFIFSTNEYEYTQLKGNYTSDKSKDVFHFYVGEDRGTVKNIKFSREDNPGLDSANILKANKGNSDQAIIRRIYQSDITLYGNTIFSPGQLIFIAPTYPGARLRNKTLQQVGIGGYYRIIEIQSFIEDGKFETVLKTKWQASGLGIEQETDSLVASEEDQEEVQEEQSTLTEEQLKELQQDLPENLPGKPVPWEQKI